MAWNLDGSYFETCSCDVVCPCTASLSLGATNDRCNVVLVAFTVLPYVTGLFGGLYLAAALALGAGFLALAARLWLRPSRRAAVVLHLASLAYLALVFFAMALDRAL